MSGLLWLAARSALLAELKIDRIGVNDPRVRPWIDAIRSGIRAGVAAHQLQHG